MESLSLNLPALRQAAAEVTEAGTALDKAKATASGQLSATGASSWSASAELIAAEDRWAAILGRLSGLLSKLGADMTAAAAAYESADKAAADDIRQTGPPAPR